MKRFNPRKIHLKQQFMAIKSLNFSINLKFALTTSPNIRKSKNQLTSFSKSISRKQRSMTKSKIRFDKRIKKKIFKLS